MEARWQRIQAGAHGLRIAASTQRQYFKGFKAIAWKRKAATGSAFSRNSFTKCVFEWVVKRILGSYCQHGSCVLRIRLSFILKLSAVGYQGFGDHEKVPLPKSSWPDVKTGHELCFCDVTYCC